MERQHFNQCYFTGSIYSQVQLKDLKEALELSIGAKISRTTTQKEVLLVCQISRKKKCPFIFRFAKIMPLNIGSSMMKLQDGLRIDYYQLNEINQNHNSQCLFSPEQHSFYKIRKYLINSKPQIANFVKEQYQKKEKELTPSQILIKLAEEKNLASDFIYEGFSSNHSLRRQIKKKFDNIVAEVKKQIIPPQKKRKFPKYIVEKGMKPFSAILRRVDSENQLDNDQEYIISKSNKTKANKELKIRETLQDQRDSYWTPESGEQCIKIQTTCKIQ